jgi:uncharacterized protein
MADSLTDHLQTLSHWFSRQQSPIVVAYSGGVDSALLLYLGTKILGRERCRGFFADTCIIGSNSRLDCMEFAKRYQLEVKAIELFPLNDPQFVKNDAHRCYICKHNTYSAFSEKLPASTVLVDGTNTNDLSNDRPGFRAVKELAVATPYLDCHIGKDIIRSLSYHLGLTTWCTLSESCLATRIQQNTPITTKLIHNINSIQQELHGFGFTACRIQIAKQTLAITVHTGQIKLILDNNILKQVQNMGKRLNFTKVFLDLFEREGILPSLLDVIGFEGDRAPQKQFLTHFNNMSGSPSARS